MHHHQPVTTVVMYYLAEVLWGQLIKIFFSVLKLLIWNANISLVSTRKKSDLDIFPKFLLFTKVEFVHETGWLIYVYKYYKNADTLEYKKSFGHKKYTV